MNSGISGFAVAVIALLFPFTAALAGNVNVGKEHGVLSFENGTEGTIAKRSAVTISGDHSKLGGHSLLWEWSKKGATLTFKGEIPYLHENPNPKETSVSSFVFWVYSPTPFEGKMTFSFRKDGRECCSFDYGMQFTGWRGAWVAFDRDMKGQPEEGMDEFVISAPEGSRRGRLFFDGIIPASFQDVRYHTSDWQAPFINANTTSHWLILNNSWKLALDIPQKAALSAQEIKDMDTVRERFVELACHGKHPWKYERISEKFDSYGIEYNKDGTITGKPVFFTRYGETFINLGIKDMSRQWGNNGQLLRDANDFMFQIALKYKELGEIIANAGKGDAVQGKVSGLGPKGAKDNAKIDELEAQRGDLALMYVMMTRHMLDQGFAAGSALGTLHHLGYSMRNFYTGPVIMQEVLREAGLDQEVQQAMEWFSGVGEIKIAPKEPGMDIDAFNTSLMGRAASILMLPDNTYKYAYMQALSRWVDNGMKLTDGLLPCFKPDGTVMHHRKAYPAYATGGFDGAVNAVWMLAGTSLGISEESHGNLKRALLDMRFYCNKESFPLAMSGRHPDGDGALIPRQYELLAKAGSPDGKQAVDADLEAAFLRLASENGKANGPAKTAQAAGELSSGETESGADITAEASPQGTRVYPFACAMSHRRADWLVTFAGHSRYIWAAEIYNGANLFGRYLTHGSMQIMADGQPEISSHGSGYQVAGWDWCHIPGTTAAEIPMERMLANVLNVDEFSGYEEMLLSDEWFAGGVSHKGMDGAFAMILHEHDKYNGSLRAHKSFFAIGNRIITLGSGLQNRHNGAPLHTTLFQNTIEASTPTTVNGESILGTDYRNTLTDEVTTLSDRFGNAFFVYDGQVVVSRGMQKSLHEETAEPTEGMFEKAYINHGTIVGRGVVAGDIFMKDGYEYMTVVHATDAEKAEYAVNKPYEVLRCDNNAHIVKDLPTGIIAAAVFAESKVDDIVLKATPCMLMYSIASGDVDEHSTQDTGADKGSGTGAGSENDIPDTITLSVSNPDLALYGGVSDEILDENGKRVERSIYGRKWVDNPCGETSVQLTLSGNWTGTLPENVTLTHTPEGTILAIRTRQARTEEFTLTRAD